MITTTRDGQLIHYEVLGRGQAGPVIFLHSWIGSWRYWWPVMQGVSAQYRTFALDMWGFGDSSKREEAYSLHAYVKLLEEFTHALSVVRPMTLVGHGLGAAVALKYAQKHPEHITKLATIAFPIQGKALDERLTTLDVHAYFNRVLGKSGSYPEIEKELRKVDAAAVNALAREISEADFTNELANCICPVLMIYGRQDTLVTPPADIYTHYNNAAASRLIVELDDCAHFPMLEQTIQFNRLLLEFLHADGDALTDLVPKEDFWQRRVR